MRVFVEGNIGAGKSTFLKYLKEHSNGAEIIPEPIEKWEDFCGFNLLKEMYEEPAIYGTPFQMYAMLTMFEAMTNKENAKLVFFERSFLSMKHIFIPTMHTYGNMPLESVCVFIAWIDFITKNRRFEPDVIVYIKTSAQVLSQRIKNRGRQGEQEIDFDRLLILQNRYDEWINKMIERGDADESKLVHSNEWIIKSLFQYIKPSIIIINGDLDEDEIKCEYEKCVMQLKRFWNLLK